MNNARDFINSFETANDNIYYLYAGYTNTSLVANTYDNTSNTLSDAYRNMAFGKKIQSTDVSLSIPRIDYLAGTVYAQYDDIDTSLFSKNFYAGVQQGSFYNVFKCLYNSGNSASTVTPDVTQVSANDQAYITSDGYMWKYMFSVDSANYDKFSTASYVPVIANSEVSSAAVPGSIDVINVTYGGAGYINYVSNTKFNSTDIISTNTFSIPLSNPNLIGTNALLGCYIHITGSSNTALIGQFQPIIASYSNSTGNYIQVAAPFTTKPDNSTYYEIYPGVVVVGDGTETETAVGLALVNTNPAAANAIYRVKMLDSGENYKYASATVGVSSSITPLNGFSAATVRPVLPPRGGHGYDAAKELGAVYAVISTSFSNTEGNTIPAVGNNQFNQIGLMKNPLFSSVTLNLTNKSGNFSNSSYTGDVVYKVNPIETNGVLSVNSSSNSATVVSGNLVSMFNVNDYIYISSGSNYDINQVVSINSTSVVFSDPSTFTSTGAIVYLPRVSSYGTVIASTPTTVVLDQVSGVFTAGDQIIGSSTGTTASVVSVSRSGQTKDFNTFIQMYAYPGSIASGSFINGEVIASTDIPVNPPNAVFYTIVSNSSLTTLYTTQQSGAFDVGGSNRLKGQTSGAQFNPTNKYSPELVFGSGEVIYVENISPVTRAPDQTENFKLVLEF